MSWPVSLLLLASAFEFIMLFLVRGRSRSAAAGPFMVVLLLSGLWTFGYALDLSTDDPEEKLRLLQVRMLFLPFYTLAWLETAHRFAIGRPFLTGWTLRAALVIPVATVALTWLPPFSHLVHSDFRVDTSGPVPVLLKTVGPWGHVYSLYNYATGLLAIVFILRARLHGRTELRWRNLFLAGGLLGFASDVLFVFGLSPAPGLNLAPFILPLTSALIAVALMGNPMKDLAPVARATLIEHLPLRLLVFDEEDRLVDLNRAAAASLGRTVRDLVGRPADEALASVAPVLDFLRTAEPESTRELTVDGRVLEARLLAVEGGGRVLSLDDITERKRAEEQLRLAKESAEAAEVAQGRFLAMMSHEVRTPMNGMLGFAQILADTPLNEEQRECVEQIDRNGRALLVILNDVLDFSKITAGHLAVEQVPCDIAELARNACKLFEPQARDKGLDLEWRVASGFPASLAADPVRIGQVITNLLGNALKFTREGGVSLELDFVAAPAGPAVVLRVHDTGPGIATAEQERIFRPFEQADASTTRKFGGTGLGLTITRSLCELMGGSLTVSSEPGKGSTFTATFRVGTPAATEPPAPSPAPPASADSLRLLVFEDNLINQRVIQALLEKQGHRVRLAGDGAQGLALLAEHSEGFDAILMDIEMPVMDGFEAVRRIRSSDRPGDRNRHIIALTAHAMAGERQRALAAGCNDFLTKPVRAEDLRAALARVPRPVRPAC